MWIGTLSKQCLILVAGGSFELFLKFLYDIWVEFQCRPTMLGSSSVHLLWIPVILIREFGWIIDYGFWN